MSAIAVSARKTPKLIILPGLDGTAKLHAAFCNALAPDFTSVSVITYPPDQRLDYPALELLVRAQLPVDRPFVLLAESFSGPIAISIAARAPANLVGLVLTTSFASAPVPWISPFAAWSRFAPVRSLPMSLLSWVLLGRWSKPELRANLRSALRSVEPEVLRFRASAALRANVLALCRQILVPVLFVRASHDRLLAPHAGKQVAIAVPHCEQIVIDGPHLLLQAAPEAAALTVKKFALRLNSKLASCSETNAGASALCATQS
jgi:pimeloyl-[acyl-carrier protein] methyl ester esterase